MEEQPSYERFPTPEALLEYLRERSDDIETVNIPVQPHIALVAPDGRSQKKSNVGAMLKLCSGRSLMIHREDAEMLINDGVLQRLKIRCILDPLDGSASGQ